MNESAILYLKSFPFIEFPVFNLYNIREFTRVTSKYLKKIYFHHFKDL